MNRPPLNNVFVFKSNIYTEDDKARISKVLDAHPSIEQWSVDITDVDHVLRVVSPCLSHSHIVDLLSDCGYRCEELKD